MPSSFAHFRAERLFRRSVLQADLQCDGIAGQSFRLKRRKPQASARLSNSQSDADQRPHTCSL